jgi:hypothetical protein
MKDETKNHEIEKCDNQIPKGLSDALSLRKTTTQKSLEEKLPAGLANALENPDGVTGAPVAAPEIREAIVAFVDMLGTSALMEGITEENKNDTYGKITGIAEEFQKGFRIIQKEYPESIGLIISDSFVISIPSENDAFQSLLSFLANFQYTCLNTYIEPMRGAISMGKMLTGGQIIGPAFIRAHRIEMENAIFPRIVVDRTIVEDNNLCPNFDNLPIVLDKDGINYIDFLKNQDTNIDAVKVQARKKHTELKRNKRELKILQKWDWLLTFLEQKERGCLNCCKPQVTH